MNDRFLCVWNGLMNDRFLCVLNGLMNDRLLCVEISVDLSQPMISLWIPLRTGGYAD